MNKYNFDIEKLRADDQREWSNLYTKLHGMIKSQSFTKKEVFNEDIFQDSILILKNKMFSLNTTKDIINFFYATMRIQTLSANRVDNKFSKNAYIQTDEGNYDILTPDHISSPLNNQEQEHEQEQLQFDLNALKLKFEEIKKMANNGNQIKHIDLYDFYLKYATEHSITVPDLCEQFGIKNPVYLSNLNVWVQKALGLKKPVKKAKRPIEELLKIKSKTSAKYRAQYKEKNKNK